jgi:hypothetical protein
MIIKQGDKFGKLRAIEPAGINSKGKPIWRVLCDCGVEKTILKSGLYSTKSCGCLHRADLVGKKFNKLTVIKWDSIKNHGSMWYCLCDCGNTAIVRGYQLVNGGTKSCGCLVRINRSGSDAVRLPLGHASRNSVLRNYKAQAKRKNREWSLSNEEFNLLVSSPCFYCGEPPSNYSDIVNSYGGFQYNGIDRLDNNQGYVPSNVASCCKICNWMKHTLSSNEFIHKVFKIEAYYNKRTI